MSSLVKEIDDQVVFSFELQIIQFAVLKKVNNYVTVFTTSLTITNF